MTARKIFVTQATGQTGVSTIRLLTERGQGSLEILAGVNPAARMAEQHEEILRGLKNVRCVSLETADPARIAEEMRDVSELYLIPSATDDNKLHSSRMYIDAAKKAGVKFVLLLSVLHPDAEGYTWGNQFQQIERYLQDSQIPWTVIRSNFYMQYLALFREPVSKGVLPLPIGTGRLSPIDVADVSDFAARVLADPSAYRFKTYDLTGPHAYTGEELAEHLSRTLGHPVKYEDVSIDEAMRYLSGCKLPENETRGFRQFFELTKSSSSFEMSSTHYYKSIMKREPRSFEDSVRVNKASWTGESPSLGVASTTGKCC